MPMIFKFSKLRPAVLIASLLFSLTACKKDNLPPKAGLFDADLKNVQLKGGFTDNGITINASDWSVEYVKDAASGEILLDKAGKPVVLNVPGSVELQSGWLKLEKKQGDDLLNLSLKENFSTTPRKFVIGILADGKRDELSYTQTRGEAYEIVKKEITEVPGSRKEYRSAEGIPAITLSNNTATARNMEMSVIFKDVYYRSEFSSEDYGAFDWLSAQDSLIFMDEIVRNGATYWADQVAYKKGLSLKPYIKYGGSRDELLVQPFTNIKVRGEMLYLERECLYTFTVKNLTAGNTFQISGTWKQKVPLSPTTYLY